MAKPEHSEDDASHPPTEPGEVHEPGQDPDGVSDTGVPSDPENPSG